MEFTASSIDNLREDLKTALSQISCKYNVDINIGTIRYSHDTFTVRIKALPYDTRTLGSYMLIRTEGDTIITTKYRKLKDAQRAMMVELADTVGIPSYISEDYTYENMLCKLQKAYDDNAVWFGDMTAVTYDYNDKRWLIVEI